MKSSRKTFAELQAWLNTYNAPDAKTLVDFLGIELAPEPTLPVGQRRRSPGGTEVIKTDGGTTDPWRRYRSNPARANPGLSWYTDAEVADWDVIA